jgi:ankyrin repeat protein
LHDLQPYVCTYRECPSSEQLFSSRHTWLEHERLSHRRIWQCIDHSNLFFKAKGEFICHLQSDHPELNTAQAKRQAGLAETTLPDDRQICPFCFSSGPFPAGLATHIAFHQEKLATFALRKSTGGGDEKPDHSSQAQGVRSAGSLRSVNLDFSSDNQDSIGNIDSFHGHIVHTEPSSPVLKSDLESEASEFYRHYRPIAPYPNEPIERLFWAACEVIKRKTGLVRYRYFRESVKLCMFGMKPPIEHLGKYGLLILKAIDNGKLSKFFEYGRTALLRAAKDGHEAVVRLLLESGKTDIDSKDNNGQTPLSWAAENGHEAVVRLLLESGKADIDSKDTEYGQTPLSWAAENGHEAVVRLLLESGKADIDSKDNNSRTPLSWAAENGHEAVVRLLLESGKTDIDSKDNNGQTPLSWAARNGHEAVVRLLLESGKADIDSKDNYGQTPLSWAARKGHEAVVRLLLESGKTDIDSKDNNGQTPLSWAAKNGHEAVVKLLQSF